MEAFLPSPQDSEFCLGIALQHVPDIHISSRYFLVSKPHLSQGVWLKQLRGPLVGQQQYLESSSSPFRTQQELFLPQWWLYPKLVPLLEFHIPPSGDLLPLAPGRQSAKYSLGFCFSPKSGTIASSAVWLIYGSKPHLVKVVRQSLPLCS